MALSQTTRIVEGILNNLISTSTPSRTAVSTAVTALTNAYKSDGNAESLLWELWTVLLETVVPASNPSGIDLLVHLVVKLQQTDVESVIVWGKSASLWRDLALLGPVLRETYDVDPSYKHSVPSPQEARRWMTKIVFIARLYKEKVFDIDHMAIWSMRDGLEEETDVGANRDTKVSVASTWMCTCGKAIWEKCLDRDEGTERNRQSTWAGKLYKGPVWYCEPRWIFWRRKLEELSASGSLGQEARKNAKDAIRVMKQVDGDMGK